MEEEQIISSAYSKYRRFGYTLFFAVLLFAIGGLVLWRWYAIPIAIVSGIAIGGLYSKIFYTILAKRTGSDKHKLRFKMMEADAKRNK